ncbi:adenosine deaminase/editase [Tricladium varicosporioides]|nr:adenosine deaminase/editase [Hymenoscyphus varicosporioides]
MEADSDAIADAVLRTFDSWEKKRKPLIRSDGKREWVPLSGIVAQGNGNLTCLAAATGMKCLPQKHISHAQGVVLHDWHAEILAIRSFNRFLLEECYTLASSKHNTSDYVRRRKVEERTERDFQPFALKEEFSLHMYCSEAPCGDASMELTMAAQEDSTPWSLRPVNVKIPPISEPSTTTSEQPILHGRSYFSQLGIVRRKPSRPDAPPTLSKSCTDKMTAKQSTSLLSSLTSLLISPLNVYIDTLTLPSSQFSAAAIERAFSPSGRLKSLPGKYKWEGGYKFRPFKTVTTTKEFAHSRRQKGDLSPSNISSAWTPRQIETIIGGTLQGRKQFDPRGASRVCKRRMWKLALEVAILTGVPAVERVLRLGTYKEVKACEMLAERRKVKGDVGDVLSGWVRNEGDGEFELNGNGVEM